MFLGSGWRNDSNSHQLARIGEKRIFHELDVHDVSKVGIKRFWAQDAEMTLTDISLLESARKARSNGGENRREKIFHELDVHHV